MSKNSEAVLSVKQKEARSDAKIPVTYLGHRALHTFRSPDSSQFTNLDQFTPVAFLRCPRISIFRKLDIFFRKK